MPTLLRLEGFKFFFYANEHELKHIHVVIGDEFAKIELGSLKVIKNYMSQKKLKRALEIVKIYNDEFERRWDEWFNPS